MQSWIIRNRTPCIPDIHTHIHFLLLTLAPSIIYAAAMMRLPFFVSALLAVLQSSEAATEQLTDTTIWTARDDWFSNSTAATVKYGNITAWNTSDVTNMAYLFCGLDGSVDSEYVYYDIEDTCSLSNADFNDDISKWDVASVTTTT